MANDTYISVKPGDTHRHFTYIWAGEGPIAVGDTVWCPGTDFRGPIRGEVMAIVAEAPDLPEGVEMKAIRIKLGKDEVYD